MRREREDVLVAARAGLLGLAALGFSLLLASKPVSQPFALGAPLFAFGVGVLVVVRRLRGRDLLAGSILGVSIAILGAVALSFQGAAGARWTGALLAVVAFAGLLRVPALLGPRAPRWVGWAAGRELPLLLLGAVLAAWTVGRPLAGGRDALLVDWMALTAALALLAATSVPAADDAWRHSPGHRHEQRIALRPDPRAAGWRDRVRAFVDRGEGTKEYADAWREVFVRAGAGDASTDALLAEAEAARPRWRRGADAHRRRRIHAQLVERLQGTRRGRPHAEPRQRL